LTGAFFLTGAAPPVTVFLTPDLGADLATDFWQPFLYNCWQGFPFTRGYFEGIHMLDVRFVGLDSEDTLSYASCIRSEVLPILLLMFTVCSKYFTVYGFEACVGCWLNSGSIRGACFGLGIGLSAFSSRGTGCQRV
jgi:hypothetical protein